MSSYELSIGELDSLVLKACRGAGYSWGLSQEAGRAAAWLAVRGLPSADLFARYLSRIKGAVPKSLAPSGRKKEVTHHSDPQCPVMTGAWISDYGQLDFDGPMNVGPVYSPLIMLPFVAACAKFAAAGLCMSIDEAELRLNGDGELTALPDSGVQIFDLDSERYVSISRIYESDGIKIAAESRRAPVSYTHLHSLEALAHLTYVPASDLSRSGAGAGLTDND